MTASESNILGKAVQIIASLPAERRQDALRYLELLQKPEFVPPENPNGLLAFAGTIDDETAEEMKAAIRELCGIPDSTER